MKMFFVSGIGIAVFIEFLLISKKRKSAADRILTLWMFLILFHLLLMYLFMTGEIFEFPFLLGVEQPLPLLQGVFLYFYVATLTGQLPRERKLLILHFVPALLIYAYLGGFFLLPAEQKIQVYMNKGAGYELYTAIRQYAISCSGVFYVIWSALLLRRHRRNIRDRFSDLEKINLQWLRILTYGLGGIWFLVIFFGNAVLIMAGIVVFIFLIGFFGVRQAEIFTQAEPEGDLPAEPPGPMPDAAPAAAASAKAAPEETIIPVNDMPASDQEDPRTELPLTGAQALGAAEQKQKYIKSGLTEKTSEELHRALIRLMADQMPYRKPDLSIDDLASHLGVHANYLSQVINQREKKNFYDFVNTYRIEEFKRAIATPKGQQYTLLSLAYDCGFSSKSSFNRYFKKATGRTPSEYFAGVTAEQA